MSGAELVRVPHGVLNFFGKDAMRTLQARALELETQLKSTTRKAEDSTRRLKAAQREPTDVEGRLEAAQGELETAQASLAKERRSKAAVATMLDALKTQSGAVEADGQEHVAVSVASLCVTHFTPHSTPHTLTLRMTPEATTTEWDNEPLNPGGLLGLVHPELRR